LGPTPEELEDIELVFLDLEAVVAHVHDLQGQVCAKYPFEPIDMDDALFEEITYAVQMDVSLEHKVCSDFS